MSMLVALLIIVLLAVLLWWLTTKLPAPIGLAMQVVFVIFFALVLLGMLFGQVPLPSIRIG